MNLTVETEREEDGRWIAEVPDLPGVLAYRATRESAVANAEALALRVIAERLKNDEIIPDIAGLHITKRLVIALLAVFILTGCATPSPLQFLMITRLLSYLLSTHLQRPPKFQHLNLQHNLTPQLTILAAAAQWQFVEMD